MKSKLQRVVPFLAIAAGGLAMLAPSASATGHASQIDPGQVAANLGSPDSRDHSLRAGAFAGLVPTLLGSQDPRDTIRWSNVRVAHYTSSGMASASAGLVASRLGSPDPRDTARRPQ